VKDFGPKETTSQNVKDFGAEWYLITPSGEEVQASADKKQAELARQLAGFKRPPT
jgi:hypothetical protein